MWDAGVLWCRWSLVSEAPLVRCDGDTLFCYINENDRRMAGEGRGEVDGGWIGSVGQGPAGFPKCRAAAPLPA
jgi:hypothetical protein